MSEPTRILVVTGDLDTGGTERHLVSILPLLDRKRFKISVHTLTHRGELATEMEKSGIQVWSPSLVPVWKGRQKLGKAWFMFRSALSLYLRLRRERPDIVHLYLPAAYLVGAPCAFAAGCKKVVMSRRSLNYYQKRRPVLAFLERLLHWKTSRFTANSKAVVCDLVEEGVSESRIELIYNGVESRNPPFHRKRPAVRADLKIGADTVVVNSVANLIEYKGHKDLITAMSQVNKQMSDWILLCIGDDRGLGESLRRYSEYCGISKKVRFLGRREDVKDLLAASDIGVLASYEEGFSNSLLEGMVAGLPMVATSVGGNSEAIVHGESGILVPPRQPTDLAEAVLNLMQDPSERKRIGISAKTRAESLFSISACVRSYEAFYGNLSEERLSCAPGTG